MNKKHSSLNKKHLIYKIVMITLIVIIYLVIDFRISATNESGLFSNQVRGDITTKASNPLLVYELIPNYSNGVAKMNSQGFRDKEFTINKPANTFRIAMVGDSVTYGLYIDNQKDSFPSKLEELLNNNTENKSYETINFGVPGYSTMQEVILINDTVLKYKPDLIIVTFLLNDIDEEYQFTIKNWFTKESYDKREALKQDFKDESYYCRIKNGLKKLNTYKRIKDISNKFSKQTSDIEQIHYDRWKKLYNDGCEVKGLNHDFYELKKISKDNNIPVIVAIHPFLLWSQDYPEQDINEEIKAMLTENNLPYIDLSTAYLKYKPEDVRIKQDPLDKDHPNELGHKLVAKTIYDYLIENKLV